MPTTTRPTDTEMQAAYPTGTVIHRTDDPDLRVLLSWLADGRVEIQTTVDGEVTETYATSTRNAWDTTIAPMTRDGGATVILPAVEAATDASVLPALPEVAVPAARLDAVLEARSVAQDEAIAWHLGAVRALRIAHQQGRQFEALAVVYTMVERLLTVGEGAHGLRLPLVERAADVLRRASDRAGRPVEALALLERVAGWRAAAEAVAS